jgi:hypothetical protein
MASQASSAWEHARTVTHVLAEICYLCLGTAPGTGGIIAGEIAWTVEWSLTYRAGRIATARTSRITFGAHA